MSVTGSELKMYQATTMPASLATANVGGAISATEITGSAVGEVFPTLSSYPLGGGTKTCYSSVFWKNTNASYDLTSAKVYLRNALAAVGSAGTVSLASSSASDDTSKKVRIIGYDGSSAAVQEEVTLNGTSTVTSSETFSAVHRIECRLVSGGTLTTTAGDVTATRGSALGSIPTGYKTATSEVAFGIEATLDTSATVTNATTAPGGISFAAPATYAAGTACGNGGTLTKSKANQIWVRLQIAELAKPSSDVEMVFTLQGETA